MTCIRNSVEAKLLKCFDNWLLIELVDTFLSGDKTIKIERLLDVFEILSIVVFGLNLENPDLELLNVLDFNIDRDGMSMLEDLLVELADIDQLFIVHLLQLVWVKYSFDHFSHVEFDLGLKVGEEI